MTSARQAFLIRKVAVLDETMMAGLAEVLIDCVEGGASVSFMLPLTRAKALDFWAGVAEAVRRGDRIVLIAEEANGDIIGTVQLILDLPENQPHRADVSKMLVHRRARRRGIGEALMRAAEAEARVAGRTLLVLDTASSEADRLYSRLGWELVGAVPDYALLPSGGLCDTRFYYRRLGPAR